MLFIPPNPPSSLHCSLEYNVLTELFFPHDVDSPLASPLEFSILVALELPHISHCPRSLDYRDRIASFSEHLSRTYSLAIIMKSSQSAKLKFPPMLYSLLQLVALMLPPWPSS